MQQKCVKLKQLASDPQTLLALADGAVCFIIIRFFFVACVGDGRREVFDNTLLYMVSCVLSSYDVCLKNWVQDYVVIVCCSSLNSKHRKKLQVIEH